LGYYICFFFSAKALKNPVFKQLIVGMDFPLAGLKKQERSP
jgi:hypothetical protein